MQNTSQQSGIVPNRGPAAGPSKMLADGRSEHAEHDALEFATEHSSSLMGDTCATPPLPRAAMPAEQDRMPQPSRPTRAQLIWDAEVRTPKNPSNLPSSAWKLQQRPALGQEFGPIISLQCRHPTNQGFNSNPTNNIPWIVVLARHMHPIQVPSC